MPEAVRHVGFIGLGRMGAAIARNSMKAGFTHTVYNRTAAKIRCGRRCRGHVTESHELAKQRSQNGPPTHGN